VRDLRVTLEFTTTVPQWEPPESASPRLVAQWDLFFAALKVHGEGHRDLAGDAVVEIVDRLKRLETEDCAFIQREARDLVARIIEEHREREREYDLATDRGRKQGAVWPPGGMDW
jgi:predicted secreted Zn-dependent protease